MKASHNLSYIIVKVADDKSAYEKGVRSTISFHWNDRLRTLSIGERTGSFPGMIENRQFTIHLAGTAAQADRYVTYAGQK
jgi:alpha-D-xyloside xylohydrolase